MSIKKLPVLLTCIFLLAGCVVNTADTKNTESGFPKSPEGITAENTGNVDVQLAYPSTIAFPEMRQVDFTITYFPQTAIYCKVTPNGGTVSSTKIYLSSNPQFVYYLPDVPVELDTILLEFMDENGKSITNVKIFFEYNKEKKEYHLVDMSPV